MTWREMKYSSTEGLLKLKNEFNTLLSDRFKVIQIANEPEKPYVELSDGTLARVVAMYGGEFDDLAIEYADNIESAGNYDTEEGNLFSPNEYESKEELFAAMFKEIEASDG